MYILIREDATKVLGFTVWSGFGNDHSISDSFNDVAVVSFEQNEKSVSIRMFSTAEYAHSEAIRLSKIIKELHGKEIKLECIPLHVYIRQIENWG
jgi:hypothetical protein